ncbi:unconventional myosin-IXb-like dachs isoform X2 [Haematobia irritans]|uniref:unconventional myosin-IXb-like dachs isoform X2 n=1 Tax=Haematobia irritans TaxID=7368 RepID=UPI003F502520
MATLGLSKVFILDKYFTELQKFWETEKKLQDASSSNEAVHLQQRLKSLSTELVTLRNRLHVGQGQGTIAASGNNVQQANGSSTLSQQSQQIQQQQQLGPITTALELSASSPNLNNINQSSNNNNNNNSSHSNNNNNNNSSNSFNNFANTNGSNSNLVQQQQHQLQQTQLHQTPSQQSLQAQQQHGPIFPTLINNNNNNNSTNLTNSNHNNNNSNINNNNNNTTSNCSNNNINNLTTTTTNTAHHLHHNHHQQQQQQSLQISQQQAQHNNNNHHHSATPSSSSATTTPSATVINNSNNKNLHTFSHTLPHNSTSGTSGVVSSRNTSIPHPLPHQINEKAATATSSSANQNFMDSIVMPVLSTPPHATTSMNHNSNTLPMRSSGHTNHHQQQHHLTQQSHLHQPQHHHGAQQQQPQYQQQSQHHPSQHQSHREVSHQLPFVPIQKHLNPCHGINTLPISFSNSHSRSTSTLHNSHLNRSNQYVNQVHTSTNGNSGYGGGSGIGMLGMGGMQGMFPPTNQSKQPYEMDDLIHLSGPLTEDAVMRTLQARFHENCYFTNVGPILLSINPYLNIGNPLTLTSTRSFPLAPQLRKIVQEAVRQQAETGYPQAIILSGTSGAGKTHCSMLLLRQLFAVAGGGPETDAFKHLAAAFTVLRSLGSAKTTTNSESSRIGQFIEVQVTDGALYRTKIHCYFLDQTRVIRPLPKEKNYHIFYQMLAGLSREERVKLNLEGYSPANLRYLQHGDVMQNEQEDAVRFQAWKTCLGILGIPFLDVVRVLAAVLLLGNVQFIDGQSLEVDVKGETELNAVASLLGVPPAALFRGLTVRTHNARGQLIKSVCDANMSNMTRDSLAKALYCRTVATIVRRANSLKRLGSTLGTLSSDSNESVHNQGDIASQHASTIGGNSGSKSMAALNNAVRHATDGFIGILDMFGFEEPSPHAQLEHLCINLCAETMQHFYNTHIFKSSVESCRDEGIICDTEVDYVDNVPCIDLISSLRTGLLSMLDAECAARGTAESYVCKIKVQHRSSPRLEIKHTTEPHDPRMFMIRHFAGRVEYDATEFLDTNRDVVPDDLVAVFYKHTCNFGFATHLFGSELKALYALQSVPRGLSFRIAPTSHTDLLNGDEPVSTLTQDFHTRLDNLLRTLVHARPHFVRCIRSNSMEAAGCFERMTVVKQIRSLQVLETVNLMASGFPHRMRFKQFNARYRMLAPFHLLRRNEDKMEECCNIILQHAMENPPLVEGSVTLAWAPGKRHVFLSEGIRQHLEHLRTEIRNKSATMIQATWRGWQWRKKMGSVKQRSRGNGGGVLIVPSSGKMGKLHGHNGLSVGANNVTLGTANTSAVGANATNNNALTASLPRLSAKTTNLVGSGTGTGAAGGGNVTRPRPQPIAGTPPPDPNEKCDTKIIQQTCSLFGLDLERPPPVPPSRNYTITGSNKLCFPQTRVMKMNFPEDTITNPPSEQLKKGESVNVVGASSCRGHLIVEHKGQNFHVPFQYMELLRPAVTATSNTLQNVTNHSNNNNNSNGNNCNGIVNNNATNSATVVGGTSGPGASGGGATSAAVKI